MIKIFSQLCLLGFLATILATGLVPVQASSTPLIISEVAYKGTISQDNCKASSSSTFNCGHDKWVELYNPTSSSIDLSQYRLAYGRQGSGYTENRQLSGTISPNSYFVIANKTNSSLTNLPQVDLLMSNMHFMSANSGDKYLKVAILDSKSSVVDKAELSNSQINSLESGFDFAQGRFSVEFKDGISSLNKSNTYGRNPEYKNYGTPGFGFLSPIPEAEKPIPAPIIVVTELIPTVLTPQAEALTSIIKPVIIPESAPVTLQEAQIAQVPQEVSTVVIEPVLAPLQSATTQPAQEVPTTVINAQQIITTPNKVNSFVNGDVLALVNQPNTATSNISNTTKTAPVISTATTIESNSVNNTQNTQNLKTNTPITQAVVAAKVNQSRYELILTMLAIGAVIFVGYTVFDYNYSRIQQSNLDKFTNIVSY